MFNSGHGLHTGRFQFPFFKKRTRYQCNRNINPHSWTTAVCVWAFSQSPLLFSQPESSLSHGHKNKLAPITAAFIHCAALSSDCSQFARTKQIQGFKQSPIERLTVRACVCVWEVVDRCVWVDVYIYRA